MYGRVVDGSERKGEQETEEKLPVPKKKTGSRCPMSDLKRVLFFVCLTCEFFKRACNIKFSGNQNIVFGSILCSKTEYHFIH
jgi:hypothetical protein